MVKLQTDEGQFTDVYMRHSASVYVENVLHFAVLSENFTNPTQM